MEVRGHKSSMKDMTGNLVKQVYQFWILVAAGNRKSTQRGLNNKDVFWQE